MLINALSFGTSFGGSGGGAGGPARLGGGSGVAGSSGAKSTVFSAPGSGGGNWAMGTKGARPRPWQPWQPWRPRGKWLWDRSWSVDMLDYVGNGLMIFWRFMDFNFAAENNRKPMTCYWPGSSECPTGFLNNGGCHCLQAKESKSKFKPTMGSKGIKFAKTSVSGHWSQDIAVECDVWDAYGVSYLRSSIESRVAHTKNPPNLLPSFSLFPLFESLRLGSSWGRTQDLINVRSLLLEKQRSRGLIFGPRTIFSIY